jgi:hypothetical protein
MQGRAFARTLLAAGIAVVALPATAGAATFCVNKPGCAGAQYGVDDLQIALSTAAGTQAHDRVEIGPGLYDDGPYSYSGLSSVEIAGAGQASTTLTALPDAAAQQHLNVSAPGSSVEDLTVDMAPGALSSGDDGLFLSDATARRVTVDGSGTDNTDGVIMSGATFEDGTVTMPLAGMDGNRAFHTSGPLSLVRDVEATGIVGFERSDENARAEVERARFTVSVAGINTDAGTINLRHSLIDLGSAGGTRGLVALNGNNNDDPMAINARHVTIVGSGAGSEGARAVAKAGGVSQDSVINLDDSIVSGVETALVAIADNGDTATIRTQFSNYDAATNFETDDADGAGATGSAAIFQNGQTNHAPGFVNPAGGDFRLLPTSPLVDAGTPGDDSASDLDGNPVPADGNGDHTARRDVGAYELPDTFAPPITIDSGPSGDTADPQPAFSFSSADPGATFECRFDGGKFDACLDATAPGGAHAPAAPLGAGAHTFEVRALDSAGNAGAPASRSFTVLAPGGGGDGDGGDGGGGGGGEPADTDPPETTIVRTRTRGDTAVVRFGADEPVAGYRCRLDRKPYGACTSPRRLRGLEAGVHRLRVIATDLAGNADPTPAKARIEVGGG